MVMAIAMNVCRGLRWCGHCWRRYTAIHYEWIIIIYEWKIKVWAAAVFSSSLLSTLHCIRTFSFFFFFHTTAEWRRRKKHHNFQTDGFSCHFRQHREKKRRTIENEMRRSHERQFTGVCNFCVDNNKSAKRSRLWDSSDECLQLNSMWYRCAGIVLSHAHVSIILHAQKNWISYTIYTWHVSAASAAKHFKAQSDDPIIIIIFPTEKCKHHLYLLLRRKWTEKCVKHECSIAIAAASRQHRHPDIIYFTDEERESAGVPVRCFYRRQKHWTYTPPPPTLEHSAPLIHFSFGAAASRRGKCNIWK